MSLTVARIAETLGVTPLGQADLTVTGLAEPGLAGPDDLALAMSPRYAEALKTGRARAAVVWAGADWESMGLAAAIPVGRPRLAMAGLTRAFDPGPGWGPGIHPTAQIDAAAVLGENVSVGPYSVIEADVQIGAGSRIGAHVSIGHGSRIGAGALIHPGVRIGPRVRIGDRFIAHGNGVIGADGFSFVTEDVSLVENARATLGDTAGAAAQPWVRIHSLGGVEIGDDVEFGANSAVDYGTVRPTTIGDGTKVDNLVHIAHNCRIGRHTLLCAHVGIAGSTTVGDHCVLAGQVGVVDNISIGDRVICGAAAKVLSNVPADRVVQGYPAVKMETHVEGYKALRRLPRILAELRAASAAAPKGVSKSGKSD